jgi:hypothetical protein
VAADAFKAIDKIYAFGVTIAKLNVTNVADGKADIKVLISL